MGFPITTERAQFIEDVLMVVEDMAFPVDKKNAACLIQLTLGLLVKQSKEDADPMRYIKRILRRSPDSGRAPDEEVSYADGRLDF